MRRVHVISLLLVFRNYEFFDFLVILEVDRVVCLVIAPAPHCRTPGVTCRNYNLRNRIRQLQSSFTFRSHHLYFFVGKCRHGNTLDPVRRVDASEEAATLGADKTANSHVDIGGAALVTVETFLVCGMLRLNLSHGCTVFIILFPLSHSCFRHLV